MALQSGFFRSIDGDRRYKADFFASYFSSFIGNGVFPTPSTGLQVISSGNLNVNVQVGKAWINGYYLSNSDEYILTLDGADGALSRIDRIVVGWNVETRLIDIYVKKGVPSTNPVAPAIQRDANIYELVLADVRLNNGIVAISQSLITDQRLNSNLCGIVAGVVQQIDTTNIFAQYDTQFNEFLNSIQDILDGDVAANLANRIIAIENAKGQPNGYATLGSNGLLDSAQLPNVTVGRWEALGDVNLANSTIVQSSGLQLQDYSMLILELVNLRGSGTSTISTTATLNFNSDSTAFYYTASDGAKLNGETNIPLGNLGYPSIGIASNILIRVTNNNIAKQYTIDSSARNSSGEFTNSQKSGVFIKDGLINSFTITATRAISTGNLKIWGLRK